MAVHIFFFCFFVFCYEFLKKWSGFQLPFSLLKFGLGLTTTIADSLTVTLPAHKAFSNITVNCGVQVAFSNQKIFWWHVFYHRKFFGVELSRPRNFYRATFQVKKMLMGHVFKPRKFLWVKFSNIKNRFGSNFQALKYFWVTFVVHW